ncbi:riboflavin synthase [Actinoplanes sp. NBRC 103695]|uniref:riboflavin synthase n=1 Tax=Actinoplanes sp. NBRC 103695 TaxID=3032202 RepID=UPI0024A26B8F|nr:riboflavin synthase [Actinoplanes sp. NBRC 103695]GLY96097.1 riboflavin synthase subunit alpha [Actinoplanes sp. NBRC 103695]
MFTGIVEELGEVKYLTVAGGDKSIDAGGDSAVIAVRGPVVTSDARHGDSISVNGVCLTVIDNVDGVFTADVMGESLRRSSLGALRPGSPVNLERAATVGSRLGGHLVQGHVDGVARIVGREPAAEWEVLRFSLPAELSRYVVEKGSITVDGVSLTVMAVDADSFSVGLIPTTLKLTVLGAKAIGDPVNLEVDVIAKYVEKMIGDRHVG